MSRGNARIPSVRRPEQTTSSAVRKLKVFISHILIMASETIIELQKP